MFDKPLIEYLDADEQLEFLFSHKYKGLRVIYPDGSEETPHHGTMPSGDRFLLVTDHAIRYIAGVDDHDETREITYEQLTDVKASIKITSRTLELTKRDGIVYRFADSGSSKTDLKRAAKYINERI